MELKFSERLKKLRTDKEISQAKLGLILNTHQQTIDRWERKVTEPNLEMLMRLAAYFEVSVDYLVGMTELYPSKDKKNSGC